jgi:hypothetical protein
VPAAYRALAVAQVRPVPLVLLVQQEAPGLLVRLAQLALLARLVFRVRLASWVLSVLPVLLVSPGLVASKVLAVLPA